jgi:Tol biopolymer transport system component
MVFRGQATAWLRGVSSGPGYDLDMGKGGARLSISLVTAIVTTGVALASPTATGAPQLARIVYESGGRLFAIAADGSDRVKLTNGVRPHRPGYGDYTPDYSPDGSRVAFVRVTRSRRVGVRIRVEVMNADGHARHVIRSSSKNSYEFDPQWSPDGHHLALVRFTERRRSFTSSIVVRRDDGSHRRTIERIRLTSRNRAFAYVLEPSWAPDGERLVFTKSRIDRHGDFRSSLVSITKSGTGREPVAHDASSASFSPDGSRIAFASTRDRHGRECGSDECYFHGEIYVGDADGRHQRRLTDTLADEGEPDWSADGQRIVFSSQRESSGREPPRQLFSITPTGACLVRLTHGERGSSAPAWEPNAALSSDPGACQ